VQQGEAVDRGRYRSDGVDDEPAEEAALDLLVRHLVRVVPVGPGVRGDEPVDVLPTDRHGVLGDAGDAVLGVGHVDAVPVQRDPVRDGPVDQRHLDQLSLPRADHRAR
jgi:hypothetical protein